ncbi:hypothetical protein [Geminocystis herdmanii]|uniref:hypothetical protein n=1 Tax=Geminocystis herdmanii TaxID=669359 RepID=UPI00034A8A4E|nr:hypothetical protein [Geminocystis herdmanii]
MNKKITWQTKSENPHNLTNLQLISQWWSNLGTKPVKLAQRLIPTSGNLDDINWETQRFDEEFTLDSPQLRGITLYGKKQGEEKEFGYTPHKIELDADFHQLDIYLQSQSNLIIRFTTNIIQYPTLSLSEVEIVSNPSGKNHVILLRNHEQKMDITFNLNPNQQLYLLSQLAKTLKHNPQINISPETLEELITLSK